MNDDFDDLDDLEEELGDTVRLALRKVAKTVDGDQRPQGTSRHSSTSETFLSVDAQSTTGRRRPPRNGIHLIAAGILAAAAVAGIALVVSRDNETTPGDAPNQTVSEAPTPAPPVQLSEHVLFDSDSVEVTISRPEGWNEDGGAVATEMDGRGVSMLAWDPGELTYVYSNPCQWEGTAEAVGPTVDDLTAALAQQPMRDARVSDIEVAGFAGNLVSMSVPDDLDAADCDQGDFRSWIGNHRSPGQREDVYILDVDGTRVVVSVNYYPDLPQADLDELESVVQSLRIRSHHVLSQDPVEVTLSLPAGWEGDSQAVTTIMDGRYVGVEAGDITHVYSDPCQWTGTASEAVGPTVDDLATALTQQPMHETTVSDIELAGFAGKLVSMTVPDDLDVAECDEGEFRSWVYHVQDPGRQDDVYILDVDGTRVVIVVTYYPDLPQADLDELDAIVQSLFIAT